MNLNTLIDQFIGEEKEKRCLDCAGGYKCNCKASSHQYNQALQDLKSRKQELVEGIEELLEDKVKEVWDELY